MERRLTSATEVTKLPIGWCWPGRIPLQSITILDGDPGSGKSAVTYDLAARITSGRPMPACSEAMPPGGVVLLQAEDSLAGTVVPNLQTAGADLTRVRLYDNDRFADRPFTLPGDLPLVEAAVTDVHAKLVVIDPLAAFIETNAKSDVAIRRVLGPLAAFAERHDLAVVLVRHLTKAAARNSLHVGVGSIGIIAAARSALVVGHDPSSDNKHQHILALNKSNLADAESLCYRTIKHSDASIAVEWLGSSKFSAADITAAEAKAEEQTALREAMQVLYSILADGGVSANEVVRVARAACVTERTLKRAKKELRVKSTKKGSGQGSEWFWSLPDDEDFLRPFKDKDIGELIDRLIHGDNDLAPQCEKKHGRNTPGPSQDHKGDEEQPV